MIFLIYCKYPQDVEFEIIWSVGPIWQYLTNLDARKGGDYRDYIQRIHS
jgi:hypothetical protein